MPVNPEWTAMNEWHDETMALRAEVVRLRAALAARPQPLFRGTWFALAKALRGRLADTIEGWPKEPDEIVVYPAAVAGSATPAEEDNDGS